jgi:pimeloyl-ACP methyl ester carboxylesterase
MAEVLVRGVQINYEAIGSSGPWIAFTPGGRRPYEELIGLSEAIARSGYRILLHDRRNCGASEVAFDGSASEHEIWSDDLYALGQELGALPMYVGGSSAGARLAILYAIRHSDGLRGLLLWRLTGGQEAVDRLAENYYGQFIKMAVEEGMAAVACSEHFKECIRARPANGERLLQTNVQHFVETMTYWRECFLQSASLPIVGATEADLRSINVPTCLIAGNDVIHSPATARKAASLISNNELHDNVVERRSDDDLLNEWNRKEWRDAESRMAEIFASFLRKAEIDRAGPERKRG